MIGALRRWVMGEPEPRAMGMLRTIASEHDGHLFFLELNDGRMLARIEWSQGDSVCGGEARGATPHIAASQLLLSLRRNGLI